MRLLKRFLIIFLIMILIVYPILTSLSSVKASDTVRLSLVPQPLIDVALAKSKTTTDLTNFENDLLEALEKEGVDSSKVEISSIETVYDSLTSEDVNVDEIINSWDTIGAPTWSASGGNIFSNSPSSSADWTDNAGVGWTSSDTLSWWGTGLIDPDGYDTKAITMDFTMVTGGKLNEGVCFNVTMNDDGSLNGYFVTICNHTNTECRLWRFDHYTLDQSFSSGINRNMWCHPLEHGNKRDNESWTVGNTSTYGNDSFTCLAAWSTTSSNVHYNIEYKDEKIVIKVNNSEVANITEKTYPKGTYGFWGNNCESGGLMYLRDINISTVKESFKKFEEILAEPEWRQNSIKLIANISDIENEEFNDIPSLGTSISRMINDEIHYVAWGNNINKVQCSNFIAANNNNGIFIDNTNYNTSITATAKYIKGLIDKITTEDYAILNENIILTTENTDIMKNTAYGAYPYGRWMILHEHEYYENNIGQFAESGKYISDMITSFDKTGRYEIFYEDKNVYPTYIYVHRRPVAEIKMQRSGNTLSLTSLGYDLDSYSNNKGISEEEWKYLKVGETTWKDGKLTNISDGADYIIQLRVKDYQETWSNPETMYITNSNNVLPIASFNIENQNTSMYENLEITDNSYDPYGGSIVSRKWTVYRESGEQIYQGSTPLLDYRTKGIGNYKMSLVVTNDRGLVSEEFSRTFTIIPDTLGPEFIATPTSCDWTQSVTVNLKFTDRMGSGFKNYQYAITTSQALPTSWSSPIAKANDNVVIDTDGIKYLYIKATDNAGNVSQPRMVGPYKIDRTPPVATVSHEPSDWVIDYVNIIWKFTDDKSGMDYVQLPDGSTTKNASGKYLVSQNGSYTFKAVDKVGNETIYTEVINNIDKIKPEGVLSLSDNNLTNQKIKILWEAVDYQSGFKKIILPDSSISYNAKGEYEISKMGTYTFVIYDKVGNYRDVSIEVNNLDMIAPSLVVTQKVKTWTNEDIVLDWEAKDYQSGLKQVVMPTSDRMTQEKGNHIVTQNGVYTFIAYDKVGNGIMVEHEVTNIDKTKPFLKLKKETTDDGNVQIVWEMFDKESGIRNLRLPNDSLTTEKTGKFLAEQNGIYTFVAYDNVGNYSVIELEVNDVDKEGIRFNLYQEKINDNCIRIRWKILEGQSDYKHILLPNYTYSEEKDGYFIVESAGEFTFLAYDKTGNETSETIQIHFDE